MTANPSGSPRNQAIDLRAGQYAVTGALLVSCSETFQALHADFGNPARISKRSLLGPDRLQNVAAAATRGALAVCLALVERLLLAERARAAAELPEIGLPDRLEISVTLGEKNQRREWISLVRGTAAATTEIAAAQAIWADLPKETSERFMPTLVAIRDYLEQLAELLGHSEPTTKI